MNRILILISAVALLGLSIFSVAEARDTQIMLKSDDVTQRPDYKEKLGNDVALYFGDQPSPKAERSLGEFVANKKTNAFGKSDQEACQWAMLSGLIELRDRAIKEGGNAVINILSYYNRNETSNKADFECHAGNIVAGVVLKGTVVKIAK